MKPKYNSYNKESMVSKKSKKSEPAKKRMDERKVYTVSSITVNVRSGSYDKAPITKTLTKGTKVEVDIDHSTDDFYHIYIPGQLEGYIKKEFLMEG